MNPTTHTSASTSLDASITTLYHELLEAWNRRSAGDMAARFSAEGFMVGFDGSTMDGPDAMVKELSRIFAEHPTARFVAKVRSIRFLTPDVAVLRAVAGMVPPGGKDLNPAVNTLHTLVVAKADGTWRIEAFQNTPAQFHGRPELSEALTNELRQLL